MIGLGTIINTLAIISGSLLGIILKSRFSEKLQEAVTKAIGVAVAFVGISGTLRYMLVIENGTIKTQGTMLLIISLVLGSLIGELLNIEGRIEKAGRWVNEKIKRENDNGFTEGFVNATVLVCVGAMAIVGSIEDGLTGDYSMLLSKSAMDFIALIIYGSVFGIGAAFSAVPLFLYQGTITLLAHFGSRFISDALVGNLSMVGASLIFCIGINLIFGKKINVGNMIFALAFPIIYAVIV